MANLSNINNKFLVTTGGNVLIGQTGAVGSSILQVTGTMTADTVDGTTFTDGYITWGAAQLNRYGAAIELQYTPINSSTSVKIGANGSNPTIFNAYTGDATFAGNVGIGAAASDGNLHVRKTGVNTGITNVLMNANFADGSNGTGLSIGYRTDETTAVIASRTATGNIAFYSYNGGWSESMRIANTGIVKINTTDTNARFRVNESRTSEWVAGFKHTGTTPYGVFIDTSVNTSTGYTFGCYTNTGTGLFLKNDGKLGIGTTSPGAKLTVSENAAALVSSITNSSSSGSGVQITAANGTNNSLQIRNYAGGELMRVQGNGKVGIGTTGPSAPLEIAAESTNVGNTLLSIGNAIVNPNTRDSWIKMFGSQATVDKTFAVGNMYGKFVVNYLGTRATNPESGGTKMFTVDGSTGNVGIGTDTPTQGKVDILDAGAYSAHTGHGLTINSNASNAYTSMYMGADDTIDAAYIQSAGRNTSFTTKKLLLNPNGGNVGIGVAAPTSKLSVIGNAITTIKPTISISDLTNGGSLNIRGLSPILSFDKTGTGVPKILMDGGGLQFKTGTLDAEGDVDVIIDSGGNVGIGTTSPSATEPTGGNLPTGWTRAGSKALEIAASDFANSGLFLRNSGTTATGTDITGDQYFGDTYIDNRYDSDNGSIYFRTKTAATAVYAMAIKGSGNVGIGITNPSVKLHVDGTTIFDTNTGSQPVYITRSGATDQALKIYVDDAAAIFESIQDESLDNYGAFQFIMDAGVTEPYFDVRKGTGVANTLFRVDGNGNVGIGTTDPNVKLRIAGTQGNPASSGSTSTGFLGLYAPSSSHGLMMGVQSSSPFGSWIQAQDKNNHATNYNLLLQPNGGNVGIGTDDPGDKLTIEDSGSVVMSIYSTDTGSQTVPKTFINLYGTNTSTSKRLQAQIASAPGHNASNAGELQFFTGDSSATSQQRMTIREDGNVGIGDTTPSYKLDVDGTIRATGDVIAYSDVRVKENIKTIDNSLEKVSKLRGVEFNKIGDNEKSIGVIAQEIEKVIPEVVKEDDKGMKSVAYGNISGLLIEAIKELKAEIEELKLNKCNCNK